MSQPFVVLPVRGIASGKSRLAPVLDRAARAAFNERLLTRTLAALCEWSGDLTRCVVVSGCDEVRSIALRHRAHVLTEPDGGGLNAAAASGADFATRRGSTRLLVLPCDLPDLDADALRGLVEGGRDADVVIAPDESGAGTNALLMSTRSPIDFCFGTRSFERHCACAARRGLSAYVFRAPEFAFDVDTPADFARWQRSVGETAAKPVV